MIKIQVKDLIEELHLDYVSGCQSREISLDYPIDLYHSLNGAEGNLVLISNLDKELVKNNCLSPNKAYIFTEGSIPLKDENLIITKTSNSYFDMMKAIIAFIDYNEAEISIPGELVSISGIGVLITGKSGVGKSEAALELIKLGYELVSDDIVKITRKHGGLYGKSEDKIRGLLEIRGVGIVDYFRQFGAKSFSPEARIDLVCELFLTDNPNECDRLGIADLKTNLLSIDLPTQRIPVLTGRNVGLLIESAALNHKLKLLGYDVTKKFF